MEISTTLWILDITDQWCQQEEMHPKVADFTNVAPNIFSIIPHCIGVQASLSLGRDVIRWRQSKTTGETLCEKVVLREFSQPNNGILAGDNPALDTTKTESHLELKSESEKRLLNRMTMVHNIFEMWRDSPNEYATQKESSAHNKHITAKGYFSKAEEIIKVTYSNFQHDGVAEFKLWARLYFPLALSARDLSG